MNVQSPDSLEIVGVRRCGPVQSIEEQCRSVDARLTRILVARVMALFGLIVRQASAKDQRTFSHLAGCKTQA